MAFDADQIRIARSGHIYVADVGSNVPDDPTTSLGGEFVELGYATEDGVLFNQTPSVEEIRAWQKANPVLRFVTGRDAVVSWTLQQINPDNVILAFGGGEVTELTTGIYQYEPPSDTADLPEKCLVIDAIDGSINDRFEVYRGSVMEGVETQLQRTAPRMLPITFAALTPDDLDRPWRQITNDPNMEPTGS